MPRIKEHVRTVGNCIEEKVTDETHWVVRQKDAYGRLVIVRCDHSAKEKGFGVVSVTAKDGSFSSSGKGSLPSWVSVRSLALDHHVNTYEVEWDPT